MLASIEMRKKKDTRAGLPYDDIDPEIMVGTPYLPKRQ